jgi:heme exporter protein B
MWRDASTWVSEAAAIFAKEWRCELRSRAALSTLALFAFTTLVVVSVSLGPIGVSRAKATAILPVLLWLILLFALAAGLPRAFVQEEEAKTAAALRLAATPSALYCGKLLFGLTLTALLELLITPLFLGMTGLRVAAPWHLAGILAAGGFGLAAGSTLVAAIIGQAKTRGNLFAVLAFPVLLPLLLLAIELTQNAVAGLPPGVALPQLLLYDGSVTVAGLMLFPAVWNP